MGVIEGAIARAVGKNPNAQVFEVSPSATALQAAIDAAVADNGDIIIVNPGSHSVTTAVDINKRGITIMASELGLNPEAQGEKFTVNAAAAYTDGPAAIITDPCTIIGLGFAGRDLTKESLLIDCEEAGGFAGGFIHLLNCRFSVWYGAIAAGIRTIGGTLNRIEGCTFDGLFGGFGTAAIIMENDTGGFAPAYTRVIGNYFESVGSAKHAIQFATGAVPVGLLIAENYVLPGFTNGSECKLLDNNSVVSDGLVTRNHLGPFANAAAARSNNTNSLLNWSGNYYAE